MRLALGEERPPGEVMGEIIPPGEAGEDGEAGEAEKDLCSAGTRSVESRLASFAALE